MNLNIKFIDHDTGLIHASYGDLTLAGHFSIGSDTGLAYFDLTEVNGMAHDLQTVGVSIKAAVSKALSHALQLYPMAA